MEASPLERPRLLGELLVEHDLLSEEELKIVLDEQRVSGRRLGEIAVSLGLLSAPALTAVLAEQVGVPLETERGFGSGLWVEIARRHRRGFGDVHHLTDELDAAPGQPEPGQAGRGSSPAVDPDWSDRTDDEGSLDVEALSTELEIREAAYERVVRELAETRASLDVAEQALHHAHSGDSTGTTFVVRVNLESDVAVVQPSGAVAGRIADSEALRGGVAALFAERVPIEARRIASAPPHDPVFGVRHDHLATRLTRSNWRERATLRRPSDGRLLYVWLTRVENGYRVNVRNDPSLEAVFPRLTEALEFTNGRSGRMALETEAVDPKDWPPEHDVLVLCFPVAPAES